MMRTFIDAYGVDVFWAYKDQQMQQMYGYTHDDTAKQIYIENMMADAYRFTDE